MNLRPSALLSLPIAVALAPSAMACTSCGCTLGTEWVSEGYSAGAGLRLDLRQDFIDQSELRTGTHKATPGDIEAQLASGSAEETQTYTFTRFYTLGLDYSLNRDWGLSLQVPYLDRAHGTVADGDTEPSLSDRKGIGDLRLLGRYQGFFDDRSLGVQFGLKLPTGGHGQAFSSGPAAGEPLDRGLQLGTGTTDFVAGAYHFTAFSRNWDHFEQAQLKVALAARDEFRPGTQLSANAGLRYVGFQQLMPQLQLNYKWEGRESGAAGDRPNSGSQELYLSPGLSVQVQQRLTLYAFVQLPVYRDYRGLQLAPAYSLSSGLRYGF
jgi:hypothetical protein